MTLFDEYIEEILRNNQQLTNQRLTVEKELFHQDILRLISDSGLMKNLVFMGGTCLRLCYESERLSEDLDFCTERIISPEEAENLSEIIRKGLSEKYKLTVTVNKPEKDSDTETWKISIITNPGHSHIPRQQIHLDICHYKSYLKELRLIRNVYSSKFNPVPLFVMAEKIEEILVDKIIAFTYSNRIKNRDIWDIYSLYVKNIKLDIVTLKKKLADKNHSFNEFLTSYSKRTTEIKEAFPVDFKDELSRFLSSGAFENSPLSKEEGPAVFNTILSDYQNSFLQ